MSSHDKKPSSNRTGGIRTLFDLNRPSGRNSDERQEYYTGDEKSNPYWLLSPITFSGMLVQDPSKGNNVDAIYDQAQQAGLTRMPLENIQPSSSSRSFSGTGRLLSGETVPTGPQQSLSVVHNSVFWRNGFTVNDGPLRRLDDPENAPFLESIKKSECPKELEPADRRTSVHVNLLRRVDNCPERRAPFQGPGRSLGSGSSAESIPQTTVVAPFHRAPTPSMGLVVDSSLPFTSIQLRLADGTRLVARFNYHHTVADIRNFVDASRPGGSRTYALQTVGFPPKVLADYSQTIEQAGLLNSVVVQKL